MFSDSGDRIARSQIEQMQNGKYIIVGYYDTTTQNLQWMENERFFDGKKPPPDSTVVRESLMTVRFELYVFVVIMTVLGMLFSIVTFIFNYRFAYRGFVHLKLKYLFVLGLLSSHNLNATVFLLSGVLCACSAYY